MKNDTATAHTPRKLRNELKSLVAEAETILTGFQEEHLADLPENLHARFDAAQEQFTDSYKDAKKKVAAGAKYTRAAIREKPYQSMAVAVGAGVLVGMLAMLVGHRGK